MIFRAACTPWKLVLIRVPCVPDATFLSPIRRFPFVDRTELFRHPIYVISNNPAPAFPFYAHSLETLARNITFLRTDCIIYRVGRFFPRTDGSHQTEHRREVRAEELDNLRGSRRRRRRDVLTGERRGTSSVSRYKKPVASRRRPRASRRVSLARRHRL